jgi:hypothetical protein
MFPLAGVVRRAGLRPHFFGYSSALEPLDRILRRLVKTLNRVRPEFVVTHSLGGVLTRLALPQATHLPHRLIMLAPPNHPPRAAAYFWRWLPFRLFSGTSGRFLAHAAAYERLPVPAVPCTVIAGTAGPLGRLSPFGTEPNDGLVSVSETELPGAELVLVPAWHTWIMAHPQVKAKVAAIMTAGLAPSE